MNNPPLLLWRENSENHFQESVVYYCRSN